ncbi:MAG: hypothetical protein M3R27_12455 [Bacteroidota bacterium]|nr:hypothetical protein [Bacteroidota bacterium]
MDKIRTSTTELYVDDDGILRVKVFANAVVTLEMIKVNYAVYKELLGDKKVLLLIDSREKYTFTKEARAYAASTEVALNRIATAFVVASFGGWLIASVYIRFNKPAIPTRMFASEAKALKWLKSFYVFPGDSYAGAKKK